jgi:hypothetical protein
MAPFDGRPANVLVLGGGGLLGEEWMTGVLAGYEDATGRRAPLPPVRRDERRLDRRVEPRGGPLTTPGGQRRCHPPGRGPR